MGQNSRLLYRAGRCDITVKSRVLIVEDDSAVYSHIKDAIAAVQTSIGIEIEHDHLTTLQELKKAEESLGRTYDLMILDLNLDPGTEGNSMETLDELNLIGNKHFVPVVIYTGYAIEIDQKYTKKWRFITVIEKGADLNGNLEKAIKKLIRTKLSLQSLTARMTKEITSLSMDLLDEIFEGVEQIDEEAVQVLMISRLSALLTTRLDSILELGTHIPVEAKTVYPPLAKDSKIPISMGDVLKDTRGDNWFLVTPTCDMVNNDKQKPRVKDVLLLRCFKSPEDRDIVMDINT